MNIVRPTKYRFPWRGGNRFALLADGGSFYPRMLEAIAGARHYILLEIYLFESGQVANRFVAALCDAARRGVTVNLLLDDFGARRLGRADRRRLVAAGASLVLYNPFQLGKWFDNLARDHRKLLLVDGAVAYVGGAGITDEFDPSGHPERRWRETMIEIRGPAVADWQTLFAGLWIGTGQPPLSLPSPPPAANSGADMQGRVAIATGPRTQEIKRALLKRVRNAEHRVWIATAYFIPSWRIRRALRQAARQGVDVRLLLPGPLTDHPAVRLAGRRFYSRLLRSGVRIFEYQRRVMHSKVSLCDNWVSVGSSNFDRWNLRWNLEANQGIEDQGFADEVRAMFENDFRDSVECVYEEWMRRPYYQRWQERWWGAVDLWLNRLGRGRRRDDG